MNTEKRLAQLFDNLNRWRHLPNYQLERRADALFALYLPGLVQERMGRPVSSIIVPELPILCSLIWAERQDMKSVKADYLLLAEDRSAAYFIELKTDPASRRDRQDHYLEQACGCDCGLQRIIEGVISIAKASDSRAKYASLLRLLASAGLVHVSESGPVSKEWFRAVHVLACPPVLTPIYLQPGPPEGGETVIDFEFVQAYLDRFDDDLSRLFAKSLKRWARPAGYTGSDEPA